MTPEQQRIVRYANSMRWPACTGNRFPFYVIGNSGSLLVARKWKEDYPELPEFDFWNPLTDANDALELAEKMKIRFWYAPATDGIWKFCAVRELEGSSTQGYDQHPTHDTLPAAICAAVDAALERER